MRFAAVIGLALAVPAGVLGSAPAHAQAPLYPSAPPPVAAPPASPEAAAIARCLCLHRDLDTLAADVAARRHAYDARQQALARMDAQLQRERATIDVNNPDAVAQFRQQLAQRDALFRRSTGRAAGQLSTAVTHYDAAVDQYNSQCANRPRDPVLLSQVAATLICPAP
ncbi:MAG TPA: hypothetical protein VME41_01910 [Stellaceae bacterium]|nr:hypothetical protein [Stellaceae bacterium]